MVKDYKNRIEKALDRFLPSAEANPEGLHQAMRYSALAPGKRLRPLLIYQIGTLLGASLDVLDYPAVAVECIHVFSLIHDDLPALDDDDLRRGMLACHKKFDEATALLAGDALFALSLDILCQTPLADPKKILRMVHFCAQATGSQGLIGGEFLDVSFEGTTPEDRALIQMSEWKTARLFEASGVLSVLSSPHGDETWIRCFQTWGRYLGIAFQIQDDILGVEGDPRKLGKSTTSDARHRKATFPLLKGVGFAKEMRNHFFDQAWQAIAVFSLPSDEIKAWTARLILGEIDADG